MRLILWARALVLAVLLGPFHLQNAAAQGVTAPHAKKSVTSDADLPRFSYPLTTPPSELLLADDAAFQPLLEKVSTDLDSVFAGYDIADKATLRSLLRGRLDTEMLRNEPDTARKTIAEIRGLQEKPEGRLTFGLVQDAVAAASLETHASSGSAFESAFSRHLTDSVNALPWATVQDRMKSLKGSYQVLAPGLFVSDLRIDADPQVAKSRSIDFEMALRLIDLRAALHFGLPLKQQVVAAVTPYIAAHTQTKPDIWAARDVTLTDSQKLTPVRVAIWDGGFDPSLFSTQLFTDPAPAGHGPHGLAFDPEGKLYAGDLQPLTPEQQAVYPKILGLRQGINDLQSNIDSPAATAARAQLSSTPPDQLTPFLKQMDFFGQYMHGTHVAGIAVHGNPAARLVDINFYDSLAIIPFAPTIEWANRLAVDFAQIGDYLRTNDVRVVNMSWGDDVSEFERWLAKTSPEKDPAARKQQAEKIYSIWKNAIAAAIRSAPNTLFVCAAGNSDSNAGFLGDVPVSLNLPNLVAVGAVDQAGEETSFTSYGPTVLLDADGFQVESFVPGGTRMKASGTSMASPNVANLAAKLISLDPKLTPEQTIALMRKGADTNANGRLHTINPKATVALLQQPTTATATAPH